MKLALVGADDDGTIVFLSSDGGSSWTKQSLAGEILYPHSINFISNGEKIIIGNSNKLEFKESSDMGATWDTHPVTKNVSPWDNRIATDGYFSKIIANDYASGKPNYSPDSGKVWYPLNLSANTSSFEISKDGSTIIAQDFYHESFYISKKQETDTGTDGFLTGAENAAIELQYIGGGKFVPISFSGNIGSN
jgi:photosystem II stability/assembly factor-like uncharacterized protein